MTEFLILYGQLIVASNIMALSIIILRQLLLWLAVRVLGKKPMRSEDVAQACKRL